MFLPFDRHPNKAIGASTNQIIAGLSRRQKSGPLYADGFLSRGLGREVVPAQVDIRLDSAHDRLWLCTGTKLNSLPVAVLRFEPRFAIGCGQQTVRDRVAVTAQELRSRNIGDPGVRKLGLQAIEEGNSVSRRAVVVAQQDPGLVSQRADDSDALGRRLQRKRAVVLQKHHGLIGQLARQRAVRGAVEFLLVDVRVGVRARRVEHAQLDPAP